MPLDVQDARELNRITPYLIDLLAQKKESLDPAVRAALAALPKDPDARAQIAGMLYHLGREPYRIGGEAVLRVALQFAEEALKLDRAHEDALREKARIQEELLRQTRKPSSYNATEPRGPSASVVRPQ